MSSANGLRQLDATALALLLIAALVGARRPAWAVMDETTECLIGFGGVPAAERDGGRIVCADCDPSCDADGVASPNQACTFNLQVCVNRAAGPCVGTALKRMKVKGKCQGTASLRFSPVGDATACGPSAGVVTRLRKKGRSPGICRVAVMTVSAVKPRRVDKDLLTLVCNPRRGACPTTTTSTSTSTTTTSTFPSDVICEPIVRDGQGIAGTYQLLSARGPNLCQTNAPQNRFGPCATDADCGGGTGNCAQTPFATADGFSLPFPEGIGTVFTLASEDPAPHCNHAACIACGNSGGACAGIPGCGAPPDPPGAGCVRNTCCDAPAFSVPTFVVPLLGGLCSRLDQYACGLGAVNSSHPQTGDNEVTKVGDTSDPGPDCEYGTGDDPSAKPCNTADGGAGHDTLGKVSRMVGNGAFDADGIQYRLAIPALSTTWVDSQSPCPQGSTFDAGELLLSQIVLNAEFSTAGATAGFTDMNGDGCAVAGSGFTSADKVGPFTVGSPPATPQPYDGSSGSIAVSAGIALTGSAPLFDIGFVAVLPSGMLARMPTESCTCSPVAACPE
jgi:hypothetical protein